MEQWKIIAKKGLMLISYATVAAANATPPVLPPSVEEAYKKKCIELKRRMNEVEEHNDTLRLRKVRLERGIQKMRLERAILLETLAKRMQKQGADGPSGGYDDESEGSSEGPPTVRQNWPLHYLLSPPFLTLTASPKKSPSAPNEVIAVPPNLPTQ